MSTVILPGVVIITYLPSNVRDGGGLRIRAWWKYCVRLSLTQFYETETLPHQSWKRFETENSKIPFLFQIWISVQVNWFKNTVTTTVRIQVNTDGWYFSINLCRTTFKRPTG